MAEFHEDWFGPASQQAVAGLAASTARLIGDVVEVGCWEGRSTIAIANAVWPEPVQAVDTWEGSPGEVSADLAERRDVFATFMSNISELTEGNVTAHRMGWRDYFAVNRHPIRFLHIDAEHTYREVRDNITAALPLLVDGGVICGDDVHHPPVRDAVLELLPDASVTATLWHWSKP